MNLIYFNLKEPLRSSKMKTFLKERNFFYALILITFFLISCGSDANRIFKKNSKAIVQIMTYDNRGNPLIQGSGFIVREDGAIVTNYHVIVKAKDIKVKVGDRTLKVEGLLHIDKENDNVILKAEAKELPIVKLGDIDNTRVGENVYVIGNPLGQENIMSEGILNGEKELYPKGKLLEITAPTSEGSSGSPVFNRKGEVIGIVKDAVRWAKNVSFAVPINLIKDKISAKNITALKEAGIEDYEYRFFHDNYDGDTNLFKKAIEAYRQEIKIKPDDAMAHYNLGYVYCKLGMYKEAIKAYKQAIKIKPDMEMAYYNLGVTYGRDLGMLKEAIEAFKQAIRIKPDFEDARLNLGYAYNKSGMYDEAINVYQKAVELDPMNEDIHGRLGDVFLKLGNHKQSIKEYEKALQLAKAKINKNPQDASAYGNASWSALFLGDFLTAERYAKDGIFYDCKEYWIHCNLGHSYLLRGQKVEAIAKYKYFIDHSTDNPKDNIKEDFTLFKKRFVDKIPIMELVENELGIK